MSSTITSQNLFKIFVFILMLIPVSVSTNTLNDVGMKSKELSEDLGVIRNEELGVIYIKKLYDSFKCKPSIIDANKTVYEIAQKLEARIEDIFAALTRAKVAIEKMQTLDNSTKTTSILLPCISNRTDDIHKNSKICDNPVVSSFEPSTDQLKLDYILHKLKTKMNLMKNGIKQEYFISSSDLESSTNSPFIDCNKIDHTLLWNNYMIRSNYKPKNIVLLLDHGGSLSKRHFSIVTSVAKKVIESLTPQDKIALLAISNEWTSPQLTEECLTTNQVLVISNEVPELIPAEPSKKRIFYKFVDGLHKGNGATRHALGLEKAFEIIGKSENQDETVMILYVSRGLLSSLTEMRTVLNVIQQASKNVNRPFVISTCAVIDDNRPTIYETQFLEDLAYQNYKKYNVSYSGDVINGTMVTVNSSESIGFALSRFYSIFNTNNSFDTTKNISLPAWDKNSADLTISFSVGCLSYNQFGLLAVDVYFSTWAEDLIYFSKNQKDVYAFLIDMYGRVIIHPKFASLTAVKQQLQFTDLSHFETVPYVNTLKYRLLEEKQGSNLTQQFGIPIRWTWKHVGNFFVLCIVTREEPQPSPYAINWPLNTSDSYNIILEYQRLRHNERLCRHLNQVATIDAGSLYLSSSCFRSPSSLQALKDEHLLHTYMTYLQDNSHVLKNPGLKSEIKDEVAALAHILNFLRDQHLSSFRSKYIVRRYVASYSGVLQMFPGSILNQGLDPTTRPWFTQASQHKMRLVMIPPYLDEGGAGYIVTIAYATSHAVVAIDVTYGYVFWLLLMRMDFCLSTNITCFLMDDRGYLIYHPNLIEPNGRGPIEKQHIIHKESLVANDILSHEQFIRKLSCYSFGGGTIQRYYRLNMSYSDVLVSSVQGDHCVSYQISALRNTNVFVGIVNATCNIVATFCPCSIVDRLCLNCNRMEKTECECPCECPIEQNDCVEQKPDTPICNWFPEQVPPKAQFHEEATHDLKSCFPTICNKEKTHRRCLGITDCEWCKYDVDGTPLDAPFCTTMSACFNGVLGSLTPYTSANEPTTSYNVPISIVTLLIFGVLLVLCMFYIYHKSSASQNAERLYLSSTQDNHLRMSDLNVSDNYHVLGNHMDKLLQDDKPDPISPYCVSNNYKRAAQVTAPESDHGYSTMTQHDESEHMSLAPLELESLEDDCASFRTSVSGKPQGKEYTCLPRSKCIVVPVTVHRNMETT